MDKDPAQVVHAKKSVIEDSGGTTSPGMMPLMPMAPHPGAPGDRGVPPGEPVSDEPTASEPFLVLATPAHDLSAPATPLVYNEAPSGDFVPAELTPVRQEMVLVVRAESDPVPHDEPPTDPDCCSCCGGEHHDGSVPLQDAYPAQYSGDAGLPSTEPLTTEPVQRVEALADPSGGDRLWEKVEWPQDGQFQEPVPLEPVHTAVAAPAVEGAVAGPQMVQVREFEGPDPDGAGPLEPFHTAVAVPAVDGAVVGPPMVQAHHVPNGMATGTDPSGPLQPGEVLLREVKGPDPDGAGPLEPHVTYEAVRVLPEGDQGGEPLQSGDRVLQVTSGPDPDGSGPGTPAHAMHAFEIGPDGSEEHRVEPIPLGEAPPILRDHALAIDPNVRVLTDRPGGDGSVPMETWHLLPNPFAPGAGQGGDTPQQKVAGLERGAGGEPGSRTPTSPQNVVVAPTPGSGKGDEGKDEGKDEDKDETKDEGKEEGGGGGAGGGKQDGNVSPDPNLKFDEGAYNQLLGVIHSVKIALQEKAARTGGMTIDADWKIVRPYGDDWPPGKDLYDWGHAFGESVEKENGNLRNKLDMFETALVSAKGVFKDTDDLAAYSASVFMSEYPDFGK